MSGGDAVEAVRKGFFKKQVELDEVVAENVGIRGQSFPIPFVDALDDPVLVFGNEIERMEGEFQIPGDPFGFRQVDFRGAVPVVALKVDHESGMDVVSRLFQEVC